VLQTCVYDTKQTLFLFGFDLNKPYVCVQFMKKLSQLQIGKTGIIKEFTDLEMSLKLMEMGCLPGEEIRVERVAPLGDPIAVNVSGYMLSLRKQEASTIILQ
jgi:ferrous iron transport protein A